MTTQIFAPRPKMSMQQYGCLMICCNQSDNIAQAPATQCKSQHLVTMLSRLKLASLSSSCTSKQGSKWAMKITSTLLSAFSRKWVASWVSYWAIQFSIWQNSWFLHLKNICFEKSGKNTLKILSYLFCQLSLEFSHLSCRNPQFFQPVLQALHFRVEFFVFAGEDFYIEVDQF